MKEQKVLAEELHAPSRKRFQTRRTITLGIRDLFQADLVDMQQLSRSNKGNKYYLAVIDTFSKMGYAEPLKSKSMKDVTEAMKKIIQRSGVPKNLQTDQGLEFFNKEFKGLMKENGINHYNTWTDKKAAIVERWNRTVKNKIWKMFTEKNTTNWIDSLQHIVDEYNNKKHSTIKMRPVDVNKDNEYQVAQRLATSKTSIKDPKYKVGDFVRLSRYKNIFEKGYTGNWTEEIFEIVTVKNTVPITYKVKDMSGELLQGTFYELELKKTKIGDYYRIEKILQKKKMPNGIVKLKVRWKGYDKKYDSWIDMEDTEKL
jgi:L-rhamnose mutarotase